MERRGAGLAPKSLIDATALERFPWNKALRVRVVRDRSNPQLRLYWSLLTKVADNLDQDVSPEDLHEWLKMKLGYTKPIRLKSGEVAEVAASVALDKMEQAEFNTYFNASTDLLVQQVIPGLNRESLVKEAQAMLGGS